MTADEIRKIIEEELKSKPDINNVFGLNLTERLIVPTIQQYWSSPDKETSEKLWTVLEETPDKSGYVIYFDEETKMFGLGIQSNNELFNIGNYGTFLKTLYFQCNAIFCDILEATGIKDLYFDRIDSPPSHQIYFCENIYDRAILLLA